MDDLPLVPLDEPFGGFHGGGVGVGWLGWYVGAGVVGMGGEKT